MTRTVTICSIGDVKALEGTIGRAGRLIGKPFPLDTGIPGVGMEFTFTKYFPGYETPRHTHTFDQFRFALEGSREIQGGALQAGDAGFYPEGVRYGPQLQTEVSSGVGLQFMGPNGGPYMTHADLIAAQQRLKAEGGTFEGGVYTKVLPNGRKINKDGHAACYELLAGHPPRFPKARFDAPIIMRQDAFRWVPDRRLRGVEHKHMGQFGEYRSGIGLRRLAPGAVIPAHHQDDAEILYLIDGSIRYEGRTWKGGKTEDEGTYMFIPNGAEPADISSETGGAFLVISLPMLADIEAEREAAAQS
jgi:quercetin dioxygenase-like cupin family protein